MNVSKRLVGMMQMTQNLAGKSTSSSFPTQIFQSQRQITAVRQIFPYHIVFSVNRPCSEQALAKALDYVTLIAFSNYNADEMPLFEPHHKEARIPPNPSFSFEEIKNMLNGFLIRFFEDEASRENLDWYHPIYIPKDIITPHLFALQQIKTLQKAHPVSTIIVQKAGRTLLSTAGPFMTNFCALQASCSEVYNKRVHYVFGNYFNSEPALSKHQESTTPNQAAASYSQLYITNFASNGMAFILVSAQPTTLKQNAFAQQLQQLNDKLQPQGTQTAVFTRLQEQIYPVFAPIPGCIDVCGVDAARIFRALRGVQNLQVIDGKVDYGVGLLDGGLLQYFQERHVLDAYVVNQQDEQDVGRQFVKQGEFYAFGDNGGQAGGLLSGGKKQKPLVLAVYKADEQGWVRSAGAAVINEGDLLSKVQEQIMEQVRVYLRIEWM